MRNNRKFKYIVGSIFLSTAVFEIAVLLAIVIYGFWPVYPVVITGVHHGWQKTYAGGACGCDEYPVWQQSSISVRQAYADARGTGDDSVLVYSCSAWHRYGLGDTVLIGRLTRITTKQ